jgi:signal transduction histidine kinase
LINESKESLTQVHIYQSALIAPFNHLALIFSTDTLPLGAASELVVFFVVLLSVVIIGGCIGFYCLGMKQIALAEQRLNFVSSVSHELKTPLTSILMYSEMLKSEMIDEKAIQLE